MKAEIHTWRRGRPRTFCIQREHVGNSDMAGSRRTCAISFDIILHKERVARTRCFCRRQRSQALLTRVGGRARRIASKEGPKPPAIPRYDQSSR